MGYAPIRGLLIATVVLALTSAPTSAVLHGQPDGARHPYVGFVTDFNIVCSGSAISPTIFITAAHCFRDSDDPPGQPVAVAVTFHPNGIFSDTFPADFVFGQWFPDPAFCRPCGPGLPEFTSHDLAVVVFAKPVTLARYAQLPSEGQTEQLANQTRVDIVGYGFQDSPKKLDPDELFTRFRAVADLSPNENVVSDEFLRLSASPGQEQGGFCLGDSGGPSLVDDTILGIMSSVNHNCAGFSVSYRLDTAAALTFIAQFPGAPIAAAPDERGDVTAATLADATAKHKAKGKHGDQSRVKGGKAGKGDHGKRRR